jgi:hypothetical protein
MTRNTNVGPTHGFGSPTTRKHSNEGPCGGKRPLDAREVRLFYTWPTWGGSSRTLASTASRGPDVDEDNDNSNGRRLKWFVKTKVGDNI